MRLRSFLGPPTQGLSNLIHGQNNNFPVIAFAGTVPFSSPTTQLHAPSNNFLVLPLQASHHFPTPPPNSQSQIDLGLATPFQVGLPSSDLTGSKDTSSDVDVIDEDPVPIRLMQPKIFLRICRRCLDRRCLCRLCCILPLVDPRRKQCVRFCWATLSGRFAV